MKKITILVAMILVGFVAQAREKMAVRFNENEPIEFTERGIQFFVFANGEFDFNTRPGDSQGGYFYKTAGRRVEVSGRRPENFGVLIEHDSFGRVRRIGNTFINYDFNDRVSRIGTVYMRYNRFALVQIGGLQLVYNRFGELVDMFGSVKSRRNSGFYYGNNGSGNHENQGYNGNGFNYNDGQNSGGNSDYYYKKGNNKIADSVRTEGNRR